MSREPNFYPPGTELGGKYRVERLLGHGGMGAVYLAENWGIGRKVAIKVLLPQFAFDEELLARFRNEARAASAIHHPGIVEMLDLGVGPSGEPFLVMEALEGESLGTRLRRTGALDLETVVWIALQLLEAIGAAHDTGIIHRDLKPDNVFLVVSPRTAVKVLDFGISKFHVEQEPSLTRTSTVLGTPAYMSPEQARSARAAGPPSDLYALGAILYESLTGAPPFDGQSYNEIVAKVLTEPHRPLRELRPDLPATLTGLVDALLAKSPKDRPANAAEVSVRLRAAFAVATPDLRATLGKSGPSDLVNDTLPRQPGGSPAPAPAPALAKSRSRKWMLGSLGALTLAGGLAAFLLRPASVASVLDAGSVASAQQPLLEAGSDAQARAAQPDASAVISSERVSETVARPDASVQRAPSRQDVHPPPPRPKRAIDAGFAPDAGKRSSRLDIEPVNIYLSDGGATSHR